MFKIIINIIVILIIILLFLSTTFVGGCLILASFKGLFFENQRANEVAFIVFALVWFVTWGYVSYLIISLINKKRLNKDDKEFREKEAQERITNLYNKE